MAIAIYDASIAWDAITRRGIPGQVARVMDAVTDLPIEDVQDLNGTPIAALVSNSQGYVPPFQVVDGPALVKMQVGPVSFVIPDQTLGGATKEAAEAAAQAAQDAANLVEAPADEVVAALTGSPGSLTRAALSSAFDRIVPISVLEHGAQPGEATLNDAPIRAAIVDALTRWPDTTGGNRTVYLPAGRYRISQNRLFSDFDFTEYGLTASVRNGIRFVGDGKEATTIELVTGGAEKWFYDNQSISTQKFQEVTFENLTLTTDNPEVGNGFKTWSQGGEKRFRFVNCNITLGIVLQTEGTGNADLNRFINCLITSYRAVMVLNNAQSVANGLIGSDVVCYRDFMVIRAGGSSWMESGVLEMHPHPTDTSTEHFVLSNPISASNAAGNADFSLSKVRMEIHGTNKKLVKTSGDTGQLIMNFDKVNIGTVTGGPREAVYVTGAKRVNFNTCILNADLTFRASCSDTGTPMGAVIHFRDCDTGRTTTLHSRCTAVGNAARIVAEGCARHESSMTQTTIEPEDFDYGWRTAQVRSLTPTPKVAQIKRRQTALPSAGATTGNPLLTLPAGAWIKRIVIKKASVPGGTTGDYQLHVGLAGRTSAIASSAIAPFAQAHSIEVSDYGLAPTGTLELWATGTAGNSVSTGGDGTIAYIEYI